MDSASAFFMLALVLQAVFTAAVVLIVRWRFPRRLAVYRLIAPAAVPALLFALVAFAYASARSQAGLPLDAGGWETIARFGIAYIVLWIVGVLFASLVIRIAGRRA